MEQSLLFSLQRLSKLQRSRFNALELQQIIEDECNSSIEKLVMLHNVCMHY